ncbi:MAG: TetR/AcrR family transcriptional regulator [Actinomycetota bacterium]
MSTNVKRPYDSSRRKAQAAETRRHILAAAYDLFVSRGYGATTVSDIAAEAGVSVETIYGAFGSKLNLLKRVWDVTIGGDDQDVPFHERPEVRALRAEQDLGRRLEMYASLVANQLGPRTSPFVEAIRGAASSEPEARAMLEEMDRQRLEGMTLAAREMAAGEGLAVSEEEARDVLWATNAGDLWRLLVDERGWDRERFASWLARLWKRMLLDSEHQ